MISEKHFTSFSASKYVIHIKFANSSMVAGSRLVAGILSPM